MDLSYVLPGMPHLRALYTGLHYIRSISISKNPLRNLTFCRQHSEPGLFRRDAMDHRNAIISVLHPFGKCQQIRGHLVIWSLKHMLKVSIWISSAVVKLDNRPAKYHRDHSLIQQGDRLDRSAHWVKQRYGKVIYLDSMWGKEVCALSCMKHFLSERMKRSGFRGQLGNLKLKNKWRKKAC